MGYISWLPNKLHPTGIQLNSIKVSFVGHHRSAALRRSISILYAVRMSEVATVTNLIIQIPITKTA